LIFLKTDDATFGSHSADDVEGLPCMYAQLLTTGARIRAHLSAA